jgi:hypothetical protein
MKIEKTRVYNYHDQPESPSYSAELADIQIGEVHFNQEKSV